MSRTTIRIRREPPPVPAAEVTPIAEIMTREPVVVHADVGVEELVTMFLEQGIDQAPVIDDAGHPIGIVSKADLLVEQYLRGDTAVDQRGALEPGVHVHELGGSVRDVMVPTSLCLPSTTPLGAAARLMIADSVRAVPVVATDGRVIGILSATDVLAWVAGVLP